jgi:signal transduction histidine kinase/CheY-like chemotaxis protein
MTFEPPPEAFRAIFQQGPGNNLLLDPQLNIVAVSDAYLRVTMTTRDQILGRHVFDVFPDNPDDAGATGVANLRASLESVLRDHRPDTVAPQKYDIPVPPEQGGGFEERYWSPVNTPILSSFGEVIYIVNRVEDITEYMLLKRAEDKEAERAERLEQHQSQLEIELFRRAEELAEANRNLRAADLAKSEFLSRMSHELRTPLTAVLGFGELLQLSDLSAEHQDWVATILRAGQHLLELLNDVLDIARVESGRLAMSVEPVSVSTLVDHTLEIVRPLAAKAGQVIEAHVETSRSSYLLGDLQRLRQILLNLMSNAVKYNTPAGKVTLAVTRIPGTGSTSAAAAEEAASSTPDRIRISVTDEGRGLSADDQRKLFAPFERLAAARDGIEGTGLGLFLSQQLTHAMGGEIALDSALGVGSTFAVEFSAVEPVAAKAIAAEDAAALAEREYAQRRCVLYVEDVAANIRLVQEIMRRRPAIDLLPVMSGSVALEIAKQRRPDLVLLDLHLPDMDGEEVLERLRARPSTSSVPVVILSADATTAPQRRLLAAGAHSYLTKPIAISKLLATIDSILADSEADS